MNRKIKGLDKGLAHLNATSLHSSTFIPPHLISITNVSTLVLVRVRKNIEVYITFYRLNVAIITCNFLLFRW